MITQETIAHPCHQLVVRPHPLTAQGERALPVVVSPGDTLGQLLERAEVLPGQQWLVTINGLQVPEAMWHRTRAKHGTVIECRRVPEKSVLRLVATIALLVYAPQLAVYLGFAQGTFAFYAASAVIQMAGMALINKLLPPPKLKGPEKQNVDPTYSVTGGRNQARLYEPLALVLGEPYCVPDMASQAYTYFAGEDQYLLQIFNAGVNCDSVNTLRIGNTPIASYEGVTLYYDGFPGTADTGMPDGDVDTTAGALVDAVTAPGAYVTRTSSTNTVMLAVDLEAQLYSVEDSGQFAERQLSIELEYRTAGAGSWLPFSVGAGITLGNATSKPLRITYQRKVAAGQYEVRIRKMDANYTGTQGANAISFVALKSYQQETATYAGQGRVGMNIKASGQLSGAIDQLNWMGKAKAMPYWNGAAWVSATTRANGLANPGAQILLLARGIFDENGMLVAGLGWPDAMIDIEGLKLFMVWCAARGFTFDLHLQEALSVFDLLEAIAAAGLGQVAWPDGKLGVSWLANDAPIEGVINMANIKANSFSVDYGTLQTADELVLSYFDRARDNSWQDVRVLAPGVVTPTMPASRIRMLGVTTEAHAAILARFAMGQNVYMRKTIAFEQDLEHLVYRRAKVLALSHDLTQWGYGGRLQAAVNNAGFLTLTLDDVVPAVSPTGLTTRFIGLRVSGERQYRLFNVAAFAGTSRTITLTTAWPGGVAVPGDSASNPAMDCLWIYDFKATPGQKVVVTSVEPQSNLTGAAVTVTTLPDEFWTYVLTGAYTAPPSNSLLQGPPVASNLEITEQLDRGGSTEFVELTASWDISGSFDHAEVWAKRNSGPLERLSEFSARSFSWRSAFQDVWYIEVRPFSTIAPGTKVTTTHTVISRTYGGAIQAWDERTLGFPGTKTGCVVVAGDLEALDTSAWSTLTTWTAWTRWNRSPTSPWTYLTQVQDVGLVMPGLIVPLLELDGTYSLEMRSSSISSGDVASQPWGPLLPGTFRWFQLRLIVTATVAQPVPTVRKFTYSFNAQIKVDQFSNLVPANLPASHRLAAGDFRLPLRSPFALVTLVLATVRDSAGSAWTHHVVDKDAALGPRMQFRRDGVLTDPPFLDYYIEGF